MMTMLELSHLYDRVAEKTTWDVYELKLKNN